MRIVESIKARYIGYKAKHFDKFAEGRELESLKNIHLGQKCVIVGNGPSLRAEDLDVLESKGIITFAFNRIYHIFEQTSWRPSYYISQDEKMLAGCIKEVEQLTAVKKFIPAEMSWYQGIDIQNIQPFHIVHQEENNMPGFSEDIARCVINSSTVVYTAIQFAVYMGIKEIYLIGVDHQFQTSMNAKGEIVIDSTIKDYFCDKYNEDKNNLYIPNTEKSTLTFIAAKRYADAHDIKIYNATRGGKLEVFSRVDFDSVFYDN